MTRVPDVIDVWFDSAIASWASIGYPARKDRFAAWWPAPWIVEAHDQTRGWFYSQLGAGVVAFDRCPYDSVLMHGWVWSPEGEAFSKSRGGALTPDEVAQKYGMDAFRFYELKVAPPWDDFAFHWDEVRNAHRTLNILWNVHRFATLYMALDGYEPGPDDLRKGTEDARPEDRWIVSRLQGVAAEVTEGLKAYELQKATRALEDFVVRDLSRWYVRLVRDRTWVEGRSDQKTAVYRVLYHALRTVARLLAPMCPFVTEAVYQDLGGSYATVHMEDWPVPDPALRDMDLERDMSIARSVVDEVARLRQARGYKLRWPVGTIVVSPSSDASMKAVEKLRPILLDQMNAKSLEVLGPGEPWGRLKLGMRPVEAAIGSRYKSLLPAIVASLARSSPEEVRTAVSRGAYEIQVKGQPVQVTSDMVVFEFELPDGYVQGATADATIYVDFTRTPQIEAEGYAREVVRRVQQMRKDLGLSVDDHVETEIHCGERLERFLRDWSDFIKGETRTRTLTLVEKQPQGGLVKEWDLEGDRIVIGIRRSP